MTLMLVLGVVGLVRGTRGELMLARAKPYLRKECLEDGESVGGLRGYCRPVPRACGQRCQMRGGLWPCSFGCDLVKNHEGVHACFYHSGNGPTPTPTDSCSRVIGDDQGGATVSCTGEVLCDETGEEVTSGSEQDNPCYVSGFCAQGKTKAKKESRIAPWCESSPAGCPGRSEGSCPSWLEFCRTTGAHNGFCRECHVDDVSEEPSSRADVRVNGVGIDADVRASGSGVAGSVRVSGALAEDVSVNDVTQKAEEIVMSGEKERIEEFQDVQCSATCRGLRRGPGRGRICGKRCCLRYGHLCTHRCDDHWDWNLEIEDVHYAKDKDYAKDKHYAKDKDYVKVFVETSEMTREIVTVILENENVPVRSESDAGGAEEVFGDAEENGDYWEESKEKKISEGVTEGYTGSSIHSVSKNAKEQDLCDPSISRSRRSKPLSKSGRTTTSS